MTADQLRDRIAYWEQLLADSTRLPPHKDRVEDRARIVDTCTRMIEGFKRRLARLEGKP